jgi:hypothetical protein
MGGMVFRCVSLGGGGGSEGGGLAAGSDVSDRRRSIWLGESLPGVADEVGSERLRLCFLYAGLGDFLRPAKRLTSNCRHEVDDGLCSGVSGGRVSRVFTGSTSLLVDLCEIVWVMLTARL